VLYCGGCRGDPVLTNSAAGHRLRPTRVLFEWFTGTPVLSWPLSDPCAVVGQELRSCRTSRRAGAGGSLTGSSQRRAAAECCCLHAAQRLKRHAGDPAWEPALWAACVTSLSAAGRLDGDVVGAFQTSEILDWSFSRCPKARSGLLEGERAEAKPSPLMLYPSTSLPLNTTLSVLWWICNKSYFGLFQSNHKVKGMCT